MEAPSTAGIAALKRVREAVHPQVPQPNKQKDFLECLIPLSAHVTHDDEEVLLKEIEEAAEKQKRLAAARRKPYQGEQRMAELRERVRVKEQMRANNTVPPVIPSRAIPTVTASSTERR